MNYKDLSLTQIIEKIKSGETTREEVFSYFKGRIEKFDGELNSFNSLNESGISDVDGELAGIPIGIKDIFAEKGINTTCSSNMLKDFKPPYDATVIKKLNEAGMTSMGKLNMDEFAMGSTSESSAFGPTLNPWGNNRIPGGSSGGSAAAVAGGLVPASLGTDTGGSIRQPASMCGVVGFKPSYGRNSRYGVSAMASSLDTPGTITKTVKDAALLYNIMNGGDKMDSTTLDETQTISDDIFAKKDLKGVKLGIPKEFLGEGLDAGVRAQIDKAIEKCKELGAEIKEISLPHAQKGIATYYILMPAEVSTNLARLDGIRYGHNSEEAREGLEELYRNNRTEGFGDEVQRRIMLGSYVLSAGFYDAYYRKAAKVRTLIIQDFEKAFEEVDAIIGPVSPSVAWKLGEKTEDPLKMYLSDMYTIPASLAGLPGISVPAGFAESEDDEKELLPVGLQIITKYKGEEKLFEIANSFEENNKENQVN